MKISYKKLWLSYTLSLLLLCTNIAWSNNILGVRIGCHDTHTRIVLDTKQKPNFKTSLSENGTEISISAPHLEFKGELPVFSKKVIKNITFHTLRNGAGGFKFQTIKPVKIIKSFTLCPCNNALHYRYVIDIQSMANKPSFTPLKKDPLPKIIPSHKKIIMIDPGHGGKDPGAQGRKGILEKDVTLNIAKILKETLEKSNRYDVRLTRNDDCFLTLANRIMRAREAKADFFISLHADSHPRADTRGLSVYMLSKVASDAEAEKLAIKENKADLMEGVNLNTESPEVAHILLDLMKRETVNLSRKAANALVAKLRKRVLLLRNSIRSADFAVLRTPDLPAILIEMGYISNKQDEILLTNPAHQTKLCEGIREGIDSYFNEHR